MFYYGRAALRLHSAAELPGSNGPVYCLLTAEEFGRFSTPRRIEVLQRLTDEQGAALVLIRVHP
jgi:hypothetical protein